MQFTVFLLFGALAVAFALGAVAARRAVRSVACMIAALACLVPVHLALAAPFVAIAHLFVVTGATMALFLFAGEAFDAGGPEDDRLGMNANRLAGMALPLLFLGMVAAPFFAAGAAPPGPVDADYGSVRRMGDLFLTRHLVSFEAVALLLTVAMTAVVAFIRKEDKP